MKTSASNRGLCRDLGERILDVVELPRVAERVDKLVDLFPKQEALFVVEHVRSLRPMRHGRLAAACPQSAGGRTGVEPAQRGGVGDAGDGDHVGGGAQVDLARSLMAWTDSNARTMMRLQAVVNALLVQKKLCRSWTHSK